jgi:hypothetical protein
MPRRDRPPSLRLTTVPIPPSLRASPFLSSPAFTHAPPCPVPRPLTEQDELWLQDTIPLPVSPAPSESSGSLLNAHPPKPPPQLYPRAVPQSPPIVINRPRHSHVRGHTCPEATNFSNYRNSYSYSDSSSSEPQSPLSSSSSSFRAPLPYRPPDAVDTRPPRRLKFSHVRIHSESALSTHADSFCPLNLRRTESRLSDDMEFGCGPAASD